MTSFSASSAPPAAPTPLTPSALPGWQRWWQEFSVPARNFPQETSRVRARLFANLVAVLAIFGLPITGYYFLRELGFDTPYDIMMAITAILVGVVLLFVNRTGRTDLAAGIFIASTSAAFVSGGFFDGSSFQFSYYAVFGVALAALFFSNRVVTITMLGIICGILLFQFVITPNRHFPSRIMDLCVFTIMMSLLLTTMVGHFRKLERLRLTDLKLANAQLRESELLLEQRVVERTLQLEAARQDAETARDAAERADRVKSQFLASMSHELRTPLNAILNFTEFVAVGMMGPVNEKQKDALYKALDSAKHLLSLINDVLDITKIESGMMKLFIEDKIDLNGELNAVIASAQTLLAHKPEVTLITDIDPALPTMTGDRRRIRQILLNLMGNAVKFTENGSITISAKRRSNPDGSAAVEFAVIDTGPGIALEDQTLIFEPFKQTETGVQHANGTGLGLPISLRLAQAHGGRLWVESAPGEGAAFFVHLPVHGPEPVKDPA